MSADGTPAPTTERRPLDQYFTPDDLARALVQRLASDGWWHGGRVLEPSAGSATCHDTSSAECAADDTGSSSGSSWPLQL